MAKSYLDWTMYERGREEGEQNGELRGKLAVAKQLLSKQMELDFVAEVTGLSAEQLRQLEAKP